uniref:Uncharacterized protein MANES_03G041800 n=1 Tax=Rhizophora mucronata TaxID=61149 RepID=A0A2P2JYE4_RHIMU
MRTLSWENALNSFHSFPNIRISSHFYQYQIKDDPLRSHYGAHSKQQKAYVVIFWVV